MPIDQAGLLAAMDAGIAEAASAPAPAPDPAPSGEDDVTTTGADAAADTTGGEGDDTPAPGASETVGGDGAADAAGSDLPADDAAAVADEAGKEGAEKPADGEKPKEGGDQAPAAKDPLNDPLPNALKGETKERIRSLIGMVKEKDTTLQTVTRERDELMGYITETQATPEQYGQALGYLKLVNSPNRADREQALQFMQQEVAVLARMLGKPVPGVNMLEGHQDLIDEVATGRLSPERAQEIAAARAQAHFERRAGERREQENTVTQQQIREREAGLKALNDLGIQLRATEPNIYAAKRKILIESLKPVFKQIPPSEWAATFKRAYDALPAPAAPPPPPPPRPAAGAGGGGNTPLRAHQPAGEARPEPKSLLDAVSAGIAEAR